MYCIEDTKIIITSILWIFAELNRKMPCIYRHSTCSNLTVHFKKIVTINEYYRYRTDSIVTVHTQPRVFTVHVISLQYL